MTTRNKYSLFFIVLFDIIQYMKWELRELKTEVSRNEKSRVFKVLSVYVEGTIYPLQEFTIMIDSVFPRIKISCFREPNTYPSFNHLFADKMKDIVGMKCRRYNWVLKNVDTNDCTKVYKDFEIFFKELIDKTIQEVYGEKDN